MDFFFTAKRLFLKTMLEIKSIAVATAVRSTVHVSEKDKPFF